MLYNILRLASIKFNNPKDTIFYNELDVLKVKKVNMNGCFNMDWMGVKNFNVYELLLSITCNLQFNSLIFK